MKNLKEINGKNDKKPFYKHKWFIILAVVIFIGIILAETDENKSPKQTNDLMKLKFKEIDVYNGFGTDVIGNAFISKAKNKDVILDSSEEEWLEFYDFIAKEYEGNYLTIYFKDGQGVIFTGITSFALYSDIDKSKDYMSGGNIREYLRIDENKRTIEYAYPEDMAKEKRINYFTGIKKEYKAK